MERGLSLDKARLAQRSLERLKRLLGELLAAKSFYKYKLYDFSKIVQKLTSSDPINSLGERAELMMLSLLLEDYFHNKELSLDDITKRESPDYLVDTPKGEVFLEVTHVHIHQAKKDNVGYKITRSIKAKSKKSYANRDTALFLDITNLVYREIEAGRNPSSLTSYVENTLSISAFGAVVPMGGRFTSEGKYNVGYSTYLHSEASEALVEFLDRYYPNRFNDDNQNFYAMSAA